MPIGITHVPIFDCPGKRSHNPPAGPMHPVGARVEIRAAVRRSLPSSGRPNSRQVLRRRRSRQTLGRSSVQPDSSPPDADVSGALSVVRGSASPDLSGSRP